jgi:type II secretory pathway pseudopilin PulG
MRVFGIIGLLLAVLLIAFLAVKQFELFGKTGGNIKNPITNAASVQTNANLNALATKLDLYFTENGRYPDSLSDIDSYGLNINSFEYKFCGSNRVVIKSGSSSLILNNGGISPENSEGC